MVEQESDDIKTIICNHCGKFEKYPGEHRVTYKEYQFGNGKYICDKPEQSITFIEQMQKAIVKFPEIERMCSKCSIHECSDCDALKEFIKLNVENNLNNNIKEEA